MFSADSNNSINRCLGKMSLRWTLFLHCLIALGTWAIVHGMQRVARRVSGLDATKHTRGEQREWEVPARANDSLWPGEPVVVSWLALDKPGDKVRRLQRRN